MYPIQFSKIFAVKSNIASRDSRMNLRDELHEIGNRIPPMEVIAGSVSPLDSHGLLRTGRTGRGV